MIVFPVYNLISISFLASLTVAMSLSIFLIGYVWMRRKIPAAMPLIGVLCGIMLWSFGYIIEYANSALDAKLFSWNISYIGIMTLPVTLLLFASRYTDRGNWITPLRVGILLILPLVTLVLQWTKEWHNLMYYNIHLIIDGPFLLVEKEYGVWFWVSMLYNYILILIALAMLVSRLFRRPRLLAEQTVYLIIAVIVPLMANVGYVFHLLPFPHADWTPCGFAISGLALTLALTRHRLLDILPIARERAIEMMQDGFLVIDSKHRIIDCNAAMREILNMGTDDILGRPLPDRLRQQLCRDQNLNECTEFKTDITLDVNSVPRHFNVNATAILERHHQTPGYVLIFHDFTERKLMEEAVKQIAYYDPLTGLPNRNLFNDRAELALEEARRFNRKMGLLIIDLDKFKDINDTYGHDVGDMVLQDTAIRLSGAVRKIDTVSRLGGDEFIVLLPEISGDDTVRAVADRIMSVMERSFNCKGQDRHVTTSIGAAIYPDDADDLVSLIKYADTAMYSVKQRGRNGFARYKAGMEITYNTRPQTESNS